MARDERKSHKDSFDEPKDQEHPRNEEEEKKKRFIFQTEKLKLLLHAPGNLRTAEICKEISDIVQVDNGFYLIVNQVSGSI